MSNIVSPFGDHCQELKRLMDKNSMVCVPFSGWHLSMFDVDVASGGLGSVIADYDTYISLQSQFGPAFSVLALGGEVQTVGVFGAVQLWPGVAEAWAMPGTLAREKPVSFVRASRLILDELVRIGRYKRLQAYVRSNHVSSVQFAKVCYFVPEATLSRFGPEGADYTLMVRFKE